VEVLLVLGLDGAILQDLYPDAGLAQQRHASPAHQGVLVQHADDDPRDTGLPDGLDARGRAPVMVTRLQGDE
jgi:hypothetical protein